MQMPTENLDDRVMLYLFANEFSHSCTHPFCNILNRFLVSAGAIDHIELSTEKVSENGTHSIQNDFLMFHSKNLNNLEGCYMIPK